MSLALRIVGLPGTAFAKTNFAYVGEGDFNHLKRGAQPGAIAQSGALRCTIKGLVLNVEGTSAVSDGSLALGKMHRQSTRTTIEEKVGIKPWTPPYSTAAIVSLIIGSYPRNAPPITLTDERLDKDWRRLIMDQVLTVGQVVALELQNESDKTVCVTFTVESVEGGEGSKRATAVDSAIISNRTEFAYAAADESSVTLRSKKIQQRAIFTSDFNLEKLGIGGLDAEFADIFRRAFASRIFPPHVVQEMGISHVRGMLLFGPPGTGKTLIARQIGKALKANEPKIVNGPEVLNKFVGQSEENIRNLFAEAEAEQKKKGENSALHIIIFDEIDAICKSRGTVNSGTGVNDSVVNQLLSKIDGVDSLNNILLIGMTNRMDMIDEALLRPGRLEVHIEIGLPDEKGRVQIINIHTAKMRQANRLEKDVDINNLAASTKNFSGAEIEGLVKSAASFAFNRQVNMHDLAHPIDAEAIRVSRQDFENALQEVKPAYGIQEEELENVQTHGIIPFSSDFNHLRKNLLILARQVKDNDTTPILSVLLTGPNGSGKTALAANIALYAKFPFTKFVSPNKYIGYSEYAKADALQKVFDDAYKSNLSLVILDNIERLLDYSAIGPRFSNTILQTLFVLIKRAPKKSGRRIFIIATTSERVFIEHAGLASSFSVCFETPLVSSQNSLKAVLGARHAERGDFPPEEIDLVCQSLVSPIGIKQLLFVTEMASEYCKPGPIRCDKFLECLRDAGVQ